MVGAVHTCVCNWIIINVMNRWFKLQSLFAFLQLKKKKLIKKKFKKKKTAQDTRVRIRCTCVHVPEWHYWIVELVAIAFALKCNMELMSNVANIFLKYINRNPNMNSWRTLSAVCEGLSTNFCLDNTFALVTLRSKSEILLGSFVNVRMSNPSKF